MGYTLTEIAKQLSSTRALKRTLKKTETIQAIPKVQLIYAFNSTGKTRLSREFKQLISPEDGSEEGADETEFSLGNMLYYNAFTEDLFYWDNDLERDVDPKLKIQPNAFTDWVLNDQGQDQNIIATFQRYTDEKLTPRFNEEYSIRTRDGAETTVNAFSEVTFTRETGDNERTGNLKISKGEESIFIWSVFFSLLEQVIAILDVPEPAARETSKFDQLQYVFIDDPVSSLDENHLIQLAVNLGQLIKKSSAGIKFIVSTHNPLFYNVLYNEVSAKSGFILSRLADGTYELEEKKGDSNTSFSYHLHIKKTIEQAIKDEKIQRYHFALLRNLYEKTANFLGYRSWSDLLPGDQQAYASRIMNFYPHSTLSNEEIAEPTAPEKAMVGLLLSNLNQYGYWKEEEKQHG